MTPINEPLLELFQAHDIEAVLQDGWVVFPNRTVRANASIVREPEQHGGRSVQLDVRLEIAPGRIIIESFAGLGETRDKAVADALHNFAANSFHVFLAAFFRPDDPQVTREEWLIGGRTSRVTIGNMGIRGKLPGQSEHLPGFFKQLEDKIKASHLRPGTHWVRLYYGQMQRKALACEVLLDNGEWSEVQSEMAAFDWPAGDEFYSVRVFLVIEVEKGGVVSTENAVAWLADIVAPRQQFTEDEVYAAMAEAGVPDALADRAYKFTQIAWGRALLAGLRVRFSPEYLCLNASGKVIESGRLEDEPCFAVASRLAGRNAGAPGFKQLALMSADVHAVNDLLHKGSKPENIITAPACLFMEAPTAAGMENARQEIARHMTAPPKSAPEATRPAAPKKSWWRFWR